MLELLVVVAIIGLLVSVMAASLSKARQASRAVKCMSNFKTVSQEFFLFADDHGRYRSGGSRGNSRLFSLEDFQEKLYRIDDYWDAGPVTEREIDVTKLPLACPAASGTLRKQKGLPCSSNAVGPPENISVAFNMRLYQVTTMVMGWPIFKRTRLDERILERGTVPLAFCADGEEAVDKGVVPYYAAPPAGELNLYGTGQFWFPSLRHSNTMNVAYIGGHVLRLADADNIKSAAWRYQPPLR